MELSRRRFARLAGTAALAGPHLRGQQAPITAQQIIDRIQKNVGIPWLSGSLDTIKAGDPATALTGIATTAMATMDVLTRASKEEANFIVTTQTVLLSEFLLGGIDGIARNCCVLESEKGGLHTHYERVTIS
jgi:hypothetical protein